MRTLSKISTIILLFCLLFTLSSCEEDLEVIGVKIISGNITYPDGVVEGAIIFITYNSTEDTGNYDYSTTSDASGNYRFEHLDNGDYFVNAKYVDELGFSFGTPGAHVAVNNQNKDEVIIVDFVLE